MLLTGILCIACFLTIWSIISETKIVKEKGDLVYATIVEIQKRHPDDGVYLVINGEKMYSSGLSSNKVIGDTIAVRYIEGIERVVQEWRNPPYYLQYILTSILLVLGIVLIIESFKGKKMREYKSMNISIDTLLKILFPSKKKK